MYLVSQDRQQWEVGQVPPSPPEQKRGMLGSFSRTMGSCMRMISCRLGSSRSTRTTLADWGYSMGTSLIQISPTFPLASMWMKTWRIISFFFPHAVVCSYTSVCVHVAVNVGGLKPYHSLPVLLHVGFLFVCLFVCYVVQFLCQST